MNIDSDRLAKGMYWQQPWSLVSGCTPCGLECLNCWAAGEAHMRGRQTNEKMRARYGGLTDGRGKFNGTVRFMEADLVKPIQTRKPTVWAVWTDLFHEKIDLLEIGRAWDEMEQSPQHTFLVLTKRPSNMLEFFETLSDYEPLPNVFLGTTCGHPDSLWRIEELLKCPAVVRYVSCEPLLAELDIRRWTHNGLECSECNWTGCEARATPHDFPDEAGGWACPKCSAPCAHTPTNECIDWLVIGPETGRKRRPCKPEWIQSLIDQADAAGIPVFVKAFPINRRVSKNMAEWPEWARRREFPRAAEAAGKE